MRLHFAQGPRHRRLSRRRLAQAGLRRKLRQPRPQSRRRPNAALIPHTWLGSRTHGPVPRCLNFCPQARVEMENINAQFGGGPRGDVVPLPSYS